VHCLPISHCTSPIETGTEENARMKWLDGIPLMLLLPLAVLLALAPFTPEPHLVEKFRMLFNGTLSRPIDILDLFLHGTPLLLVVLKLVARARTRD